MEYKTCLAFVFILSVVYGNKCSDEDLKQWFDSDSGLCYGEGNWTFSEAPVKMDKHRNISVFLTPSSISSCITSKTLSMFNGGRLHVKVYAKSITNEDYLTVLVYDSKDNVIDQASLIMEENIVNDGWQDLIIQLGGVGDYDGYVMLVGKSSTDSNILVGSICYTSTHEANLLYEDTSQPTSSYQAPDVYSLLTSSALLNRVHPNKNLESRMNTDIVQIENRSFWIFDREDFWTPLTISLAVIIPVLILALLGLGCFALGKNSAKQESPIVFEDLDNLPKPYVVPRVKNVYAESVTSSTYAGRNNNVYSV